MCNGVSTPCTERLTSFGNGPLLGAHQPPHCIIAGITIFSVKAIPSPWVMRKKKSSQFLAVILFREGVAKYHREKEMNVYNRIWDFQAEMNGARSG